jgi:23S rRNA (cytosine1962-C5)-methyltransferase
MTRRAGRLPRSPTRDGLPTVRVAAELEGALAARHPWVYRDHLPSAAPGLPHGSWVRVEAGQAAAVGLYDADGAIAVRCYRFAPRGGPLAVPDRATLEGLVDAALALRAPLAAAGSDAYRLLYGEGDGLPGITADRYGRYAAVRTYAPSLVPGADTAASWTLQVVVARLASSAGLRGVVLVGGDGIGDTDEGTGYQVLWGSPPPPELTVSERGRTMLVALGAGQKTGAFLDHRENRGVVEGVAADREVVDCFAYTGGFSVAALRGGAARVTSVDVSSDALALCRRSVALLGGAAQARHATRRVDLMRDLERVLSDPRGDASAPPADLIVLDPPALARRKAQRHAALRAYRRLNAAAMAALPDGGLLATASCTAQVSPEAFRGALARAAQDAAVFAQVLHEAAHPSDHPVPLSFPEGRYLKFLLLRVTRPR